MHTDIATLYGHYLHAPLISTDTRTIAPGSIFFALKGANFNGNLFAMQALEQGAAFAVVDEDVAGTDKRLLRVPDVLTALQNLARHHRRVLGEKGLRVVALTGSNGKTTTKELLARVLSQKFSTHFTKGNLNNHIGVPLTLLQLTEAHELAVIEMGANHQGEIQQLCEIAEPDFGLITNIGLAHLEGFGGPEGVLKGKTEMFRFLEARKGKIFLLADEPRLNEYAQKLQAITYGTNANADVTGTLLAADPVLHFTWKAKEEPTLYKVRTQLAGAYNLPNALAAVAAGRGFGISNEKINEALESYQPDNNRSQWVQRGNVQLLLDAYNANPSSMKAALENFATLKASAKTIVIGDMFELGDSSVEAHQQIVDLLAQQMPDATVLLVGEHFAHTTDRCGFHRMPNSTEAAAWMQTHKPVEGLVLIKGSRGMKMERVSEIFG
ncbi:MAG: UDP-N-acetylmuramoyl-tripeptide--D-alanyl-D-alanine ligase [Bacteroidia bacterium]|jgi:UDP-N-acetylmuramoyl-tripeptide--D-alanyl-D-alanine ligase|nr:UDP-N-acetylmuramoyl-tripeptide--D-alanyl-D-alanine ligase [Bacteroidia bacterium]